MSPNLEVQIETTKAGLFTVTYAYKQAPLDVQEAAFAVDGLNMVSPAELCSLRANQPEGVAAFSPYSRTDADVFYDDRDNPQAVIIPDGAISAQTGLCTLVEAHRAGNEYVIPLSQRELIYDLVDAMLKVGVAFVAPHGRTYVKTSEFGQTELTNKLFSDENLGINAEGYGDWLQSQGRDVQSFYLEGKDYARSQKGPHLNRLRAFGPDGGFSIGGDDRVLDGDNGAFGVFFKLVIKK